MCGTTTIHKMQLICCALEQTFILFLVLYITMINARSLARDSQAISSRFPSIRYNLKQEVILMSRKYRSVLSVSKDQTGKSQLVTRALESMEDHNLHFMLYFYTTAEPSESRLVLPVHMVTGMFLSMTEDRKLVLQHQDNIDSNSIDGPTRPEDIVTADSRFFYYKNSGEGESDNVLEAMNGKDYGYMLSLSNSDDDPDNTKLPIPQLQQVPSTISSNTFPEEMVFEVIDPYGHE